MSVLAMSKLVRPVALSTLATGTVARIHDPQLDPESTSLLRALGLSVSRRFRLCKTGEPCILQVGATRIGVSKTVAARILVLPDGPGVA
jgi:Fe2+ transport system protein FeoA